MKISLAKIQLKIDYDILRTHDVCTIKYIIVCLKFKTYDASYTVRNSIAFLVHIVHVYHVQCKFDEIKFDLTEFSYLYK